MNFAFAGRAFWTVPTMLLAGCATGRAAYDARIESDFSVVADDHAVANDERSLHTPELDRAAFVRAVLDRNRSLEAARQAWRAAVGRVRQSGVLDDPMVSVEVAPLSIASSSARFGVAASVIQRLPWPGKLALDESVAHAEADAAKSDFDMARRDLALTATLLYEQFFIAARSLEINAHHVALMRSMQSAATIQFESGRGSMQDSLQAEFELAHMEHDAVTLATQRDVATAQMNELLHRDPDLPLPPPSKDLPTSTALGSRDEALLRPDVLAVRQRARAAQARAERAARESFPDVTVSTSYNSMWDMPEHRWMVGLSFNLPIQTGRRSGAVDEANALRAQFEAEMGRAQDMARTEASVAIKRLDESSHVIHFYEERLVPIARDEVDAALSAFKASQTPFNAVIDAEKNLRGVELDEQMARAEYDRRRAELDHALGRVAGTEP